MIVSSEKLAIVKKCELRECCEAQSGFPVIGKERETGGGQGRRSRASGCLALTANSPDRAKRGSGKAAVSYQSS
jgi:hypothetical protein